MAEKDTTIVTQSGSGVGWFLAGALLVAVAIGAYFYFGGDVPGDSNDINLKIELPE